MTAKFHPPLSPEVTTQVLEVTEAAINGLIQCTDDPTSEIGRVIMLNAAIRTLAVLLFKFESPEWPLQHAIDGLTIYHASYQATAPGRLP